MIEIPPDLGYEVDKAYWCKLFDPANIEHYIEGIVNGYITCMLIGYRTKYKKREDLQQIFYKDFKGFTFDIFKLSHRIAVKELQEQLVIQGVQVKVLRGSISYIKTLQDYLNKDTPAKQTKEAIKERYKLI